MPKRGFSLIEIIVASLILALTMAGLVNIFVSGKRYILHSRARMAGGELGKFFLDPLQTDVREDQWGTNCLSANVSCPGASTVNYIAYTPTYSITRDTPIANINKVKVVISWNETSLTP